MMKNVSPRGAIIAAALFAAHIALAHAATRADVIHVPADYPTIQAAIDAAAPEGGDEIIVAPGTYFENINLLGKAIHLRSAGGPEKTIIEGPNVAPAITCDSGEGRDTIIEGFALRSIWPHWSMRNIDSSPAVINCKFKNIARGMYNEGGSPAIINCSFADIGGYFCEGCGGIRNINASPHISGCTFANIGSEDGGAIRSTNSNVVVSDSVFTENFGHGSSGTIRHGGGTLDIVGSNFTGNFTDYGDAAAIEPAFSGDVPTVITIIDSTFLANNGAAGTVMGAQTIIGSTFIGNGGETAVWIGDGLIEDCTFIDNVAGWSAGGIFTNGSPTIINTTFVNNKVPVFDPRDKLNAGAIYVSGDGNPQIGGSTFCENTPAHIVGPWTNLGGNQFGEFCPVGDLTGDGTVGVADLLILLSAWGACDDCTPGDSSPCPADLKGDCAVGVVDLLILLQNWE